MNYAEWCPKCGNRMDATTIGYHCPHCGYRVKVNFTVITTDHTEATI